MRLDSNALGRENSTAICITVVQVRNSPCPISRHEELESEDQTSRDNICTLFCHHLRAPTLSAFFSSEKCCF